ncbi:MULTISPECIES: GNAT family N-acetyltransferase [Nocardia]|uniref:GNAT family N-acetyltransferase n=1 Tax=Nocardia TaxID=1817 RepID=UPI00135AF2F4|nr:MULTISPECIES: GNAT family protein [Nocardia]
MSLLEIVLTEYAPEDRVFLEQWWENADVLRFVHELKHQLIDRERGDLSGEMRVVGPKLRWMARDASSGTAVGFVSVEIIGQSGPRGKAGPVMPPFHGGVNIVVDPMRQCSGIGAATLKALFDLPQLADVVKLSGTVDATNAASLGMLRKLGLTPDGPAVKGMYPFTVPGPAASQSGT